MCLNHLALVEFLMGVDNTVLVLRLDIVWQFSKSVHVFLLDILAEGFSTKLKAAETALLHGFQVQATVLVIDVRLVVV